MKRAIRGVETVAFKSAADGYAVDRSPKAIARMMELACEGEVPDIRERASNWLWMNVGVRVVQTAALSFVATGAQAMGF